MYLIGIVESFSSEMQGHIQIEFVSLSVVVVHIPCNAYPTDPLAVNNIDIFVYVFKTFVRFFTGLRPEIWNIKHTDGHLR
ncbi:hypothetical protein SDC9_131315 [bioreactor metagenome]|uniref:Uncharacterized protein n=1 Tax=bioreactor metagenome TaxID=1076179 RepID=A0A645D4J4_9ZZZZ